MKTFNVHIETIAAGSEAATELTIPAPADGGVSLADVLRRHGLPLNTRCGQRGLCHGCTVDLVAGELAPMRQGHFPQSCSVRSTPDCLAGLLASRVPRDNNVKTAPGPSICADEQSQPVRACDYRPASDLHIIIPQSSLLTYAPQVLDGYAIRITHARNPLVDARFGVAVDVGTTTVALMLVDLADGQVVARASSFNAQMHLGDDVITRITQCMNDPTMLRQMQTAIADRTIAPLLGEAMQAAGANAQDIGAMVIAGNTTMLHLLAGVDPSPLGVSPFTPRFTEHRILAGGDLLAGWASAFPRMQVHLLPSASAFIGADIVAGLVATAMSYEPETSLLVDVGTNGEIVLRHGERFVGCATAAGPAFEGARLASGMRAGDGAISALALDPQTGNHQIEWIGRERSPRPAGLCGSAYIDFLAEGRRTGLLSATGRFADFENSPGGWRRQSLGASCQIAMGQGHRPIIVSECDVASLLSAKAAIQAGVQLLLANQTLQPRDVRHVFLAGGFGTHMNARNAIAIGMLPGFCAEQIVPVGNTALAGAYLALTDKALLADMKETAGSVEALELNLIPEFQDAYIDGLSLE